MKIHSYIAKCNFKIIVQLSYMTKRERRIMLQVHRPSVTAHMDMPIFSSLINLFLILMYKYIKWFYFDIHVFFLLITWLMREMERWAPVNRLSPIIFPSIVRFRIYLGVMWTNNYRFKVCYILLGHIMYW